MNDQIERAPVTQPDRGKVAYVTGGESTDAQALGERHDRAVDQPKAEIRVASVDLHGPRKLVGRGRCVGEGASRQVSHEQLHCPPFAAEEIVEQMQAAFDTRSFGLTPPTLVG